MKFRRIESGIDVLLRNLRWIALVASVLLLALAVSATGPAQESDRLVTPANTASSGAHDVTVRKQRVPWLQFLPGHYIDVVVMYEKDYAELTKSLVDSIGTVRNRLHCEQSLLAERLRTSGLTLPYTASTEDDGCAL
jgi:hypothetical protein